MPSNPAELVLDVFVYAPVGLLCEPTQVVPELLGEPLQAFGHASAIGRRRLHRPVGRIGELVERRVQQVQRAAEGLGFAADLPSWVPRPPALLSGPTPGGADRHGAGSLPSDGPAGGFGPSGSNGAHGSAAAADADGPPASPATASRRAGHDPGPAEPPPGPSGDELAIPDYESLSASQVMPRLESLTPGELEDVRVFEHHHRGRKTILNKIAQLQGS